ncbi:DUF58 domain-containing protein [Brevundimonas sp.]|uniref:DUF58 domain-containing protein n=1 Tax=Brevundimonas sp. TaxID=1871086 RepID=UPI003AF76ACF
MIYPTRRAVILMGAGVPAALLAGVLTPAGWGLGPIWIAALVALVAVDAMLAGSRSSLKLEAPPPVEAAVGRAGKLSLGLHFGGLGPVPRTVEAMIAGQGTLGLEPASRSAPVEGRATAPEFSFTPLRRGDAPVETLRLRWRGPLGLAYKQKTFAPGLTVPVHTDLEWVRDRALTLFARDAQTGTRIQRDRGEGSEFQALHEFQPGMDRRTIDWKQSARHAALLAKEFRSERNNNIVLALDSGRSGSEPVSGMPRIDRFIHVALLVALAGLKMGDRIGLYAFDSAPRLSTGIVTGPGAFRTLQRMAARVDYSVHETNYTLGLSHLSSQLQRRSLIMVFTDFTDTTSAELMIESVGRLLRRHLVLFVVLRDEELESLAATAPETPDDVSRAVVAAAMTRERDVVITRLRRMGVHIVDAPAERMGPEVVEAYLDLKRRDLL